METYGAIRYAICSGVKGIFTAHGDSIEEIYLNSELKNLLESCIVERIVFLDRNQRSVVRCVYELDIKNKKYFKL